VSQKIVTTYIYGCITQTGDVTL